MSACKHCSRCRGGCSDVCKCCGICNACGQLAAPWYGVAPTPVYVPYPVPTPMPTITPYPNWAQPQPWPFPSTLEVTCGPNAAGCAAPYLGECQTVTLTAEAQVNNWLTAREIGATS